MSLKHSLLSAAYLPLRLGNSLLRTVGIKSDARLRIINFHDIALDEQERFAAQLHWLARFWTFVSPQQFAAMLTGAEPVKGANLLLTFDDGFISNRRVAEEVLNPMQIKALFFVIPNFVAVKEEADSRAFIANHIYPGLNLETIPDGWMNMKWKDLRWLIESGHTIGNHTLTHARLSQLKYEHEISEEIIESTKVLEDNLEVKIEHFAYPFGDLNSFSPAALELARHQFPFIYTGFRGDNSDKVASWAIRRDAIQPKDSLALVGALLEGGADFHYSAPLSHYEGWDKKRS